MEKPKRILIFELNWLGDILFSFPFIKALRGAFPSAYITCAVVPRYAELLKNNTCVDKIYELSDGNGVLSLLEKLKFIFFLRKERFDTCFLLKPSRNKSFVALCAGIKRRIGFGGKKSFLTEEVKLPLKEMHRVFQILLIAKSIGIDVTDDKYEYCVNIEDSKCVNELLNADTCDNNALIAINPGGNWPAKRWPAKNFVLLAKKILTQFSNVKIVITGAKKDKLLAEDVAREIGSERCCNLAGCTKLNELASVFSKCALMISSDSGPLHLASAVGTVTIGIFGPTSHKITGPMGVGRSIVIREDIDCKIPCYEEHCMKDYICMEKVTVDKVFNTVCDLFGRGAK
ncbi:MAG: lipopolysaccharide heptosyltransferase II [Candidatus Omnitrophota bacterium]|nr:lipopolysaccharide heptosyltransferase II [Candidatus Omnitrophota bacterium]MBU1894839.1 lipopolysaccharide heptosyltransferase II [Candidatus Omnitrophota bacterium]